MASAATRPTIRKPLVFWLCVVVATVVGDEFTVLVLTWILLRAHEKHVFEEVCHAEEGLGIKGSADMYI